MDLSIDVTSTDPSAKAVSMNLSVQAASTDLSTEVACMDLPNAPNTQTINNRNVGENSCCEDKYKSLEKKYMNKINIQQY